MGSILKNFLSKLELGEMQKFENMALFPLFAPVKNEVKYLTMKEALDKELLVVTEISRGIVSQLKVINKAKLPVLLLAGEELVGAKQNRVLNTTILLKKESEMSIPVSCTEHGRWSYISKKFADSGVVVSPSLRRVQFESVSKSLEHSREFRSDQMAVWNKIEEISERAQVRSDTEALRDVFRHKENSLNSYTEYFRPVSHQRGLLVLINGNVVGFDIVSRESAYKVLHPKLIKSYSIEAVLQGKVGRARPTAGKARAFIEKTLSCEENRYKSIGQGWDYRMKGKDILGSALLYYRKVIHTAFFKVDEIEENSRMADFRHRRGYIL